MPAKGRIEWPYVTLLVAIVLVVAAALHLLSTWIAFLILPFCGSVLGYGPNHDVRASSVQTVELELQIRFARELSANIDLLTCWRRSIRSRSANDCHDSNNGDSLIHRGNYMPVVRLDHDVPATMNKPCAVSFWPPRETLKQSSFLTSL